MRIRCNRSAVLLGMAGALTATAVQGTGYPDRFGFGAPATAAEIQAIAIAIPPDGRGLPSGKGDWNAGKKVYETYCAACHGLDLQGVATVENMPAGAQLRLTGGRGTLTSRKPVLTVESYWPYATTLFDYIRRAMPFNAPGLLSNEQVYAVSAYILGEAKILDKSATLNADSLPKVQMPNRDGFIADPRPELFK